MTSKSGADDDSAWEAEVAAEPSYHGYLPREDLVFVLERNGDYLLRTTEVMDGDKKEARKELVLAVLVDPEGNCGEGKPIEPEVKEQLIKNVIVNRVKGRFAIEAGFRFDSIALLIRHYAHHPVRMNTITFTLQRACRLMRWEYLHRDVSVGKVLGAGAFGEVHKGTLKKKNGKLVTVAIKSLKGATSKELVNEMMREARLMRNLSHSNVVRIYGVALCQLPLYIILEFVKGGSLDSYLRKHAEVLDRDEKLQMVMGAIWGIEYLHKSMLLHRDLASRNCLYDEDKNVKISDFGLSRQGTLYKMKTAKKMPIKWMSPESINQFVFSQKTDVYSMGVLIWEIFACKESYEGLSNTESRQRINEDKWNEFPPATPSKLIAYVKEKMWDRDPSKRANMQNIRYWMEKYTGLSKIDDSDQAKSDKPQQSSDKDDDKDKRRRKRQENSKPSSQSGSKASSAQEQVSKVRYTRKDDDDTILRPPPE